jgi:hypothetical protein
VRRRLAEEADALDRAIYDAATKTPNPMLDVPVKWIANAVDYSRFSIVIAAALVTVGGHRGR